MNNEKKKMTLLRLLEEKYKLHLNKSNCFICQEEFGDDNDINQCNVTTLANINNNISNLKYKNTWYNIVLFS